MQRLAVLSVATLGLISCVSIWPEYDIDIKNESGQKLSDVHVKYGDFVSAGGSMSPGVWSTHCCVTVPIPEVATVEWRTPDGVLHHEGIEVASRVSRGFRGELRFAIGVDGVTFTAWTWAQLEAKEREYLRENPPVFAEGELEIVGDPGGDAVVTVGLEKLGHPELEFPDWTNEGFDFLGRLAIEIKTTGARFQPGESAEIDGERVCFREGREGRVVASLCDDS